MGLIRRMFIWLLAVGVISSYGQPGQSTIVPFYSPDSAQNVDYQSFPSMLMLKHSVGHFSKLPKNPVLAPSPNSWDQDDVSDPFVLVTADSIYLFYDGSQGGRYSIGYAVRDPAGWYWIKRKKILSKNEGDWDSYHQIDPNVLLLGERWLLYYSGNNSDSEFGYQVGLASKRNGNWIFPLNHPILAIDTTSWDFAGNMYVDVRFFPEQNKYRMWYSGFQGPLSAIGLAESSDGFSWRKVGDGPVLSVFPGAIAPTVVYNGNKYVMYFAQLALESGFGTKIGRAESKDGIQWENIEDVLSPSEKWEGRRLMRPNLSYFEGQVHLYYCAQKGSHWRIGEAIADATFEPRGVWRSQIIGQNVSRLQIDYEIPDGTSAKGFVMDLKSNQKIPFSLLNQTKPLRKDVYKAVLSDLNMKGEWQVELELETTIENRSPVVYEIDLK